MDSENRLTAWEELSGLRSKPCATSELLRQKLEEAKAKAEPCPPHEAMRLLGVNLVLCSPSGMSEADRIEWLKAALLTIGDCPRDLLDAACKDARRVCDHPAKIVPFICDWIGDSVKHRQQQVDWAWQQLASAGKPKLAAPAQQPEREPEPITQEEINDLPPYLRRSWLNVGLTTQEQFDAAWRDGDEA